MGQPSGSEEKSMARAAPRLPGAGLDLAVITGAALVIRLLWVWFGSWTAGDSIWYLAVARNIAFHGSFSASLDGTPLLPTALRPPLYPAFIALLWRGESVPITATLLAQCCLGAAAVGLTYLIARDRFDRGIAVLAGAGMTVAPMTGRFTAVLLSETLFTFLLTLGVFFWGRRHHRWSGVMLGLATLVRVTLWPFVILLPLLTFLRPWRAERRAYLVIMIIALSITAIWVGRNAYVFHRFIPVASGGYGTNLLLGTLTTDEATNLSRRRAVLRGPDQVEADSTHDESTIEAERRQAAIARIRSDPPHWLLARAEQYPKLFIDGGAYLFGDANLPFMKVVQERWIEQMVVRSVIIAGNIMVWLLALLTLLIERRRIVSLSHIVLFPIYLCVVSLPLWVESRYALPMMPLVAVLASAGALHCARRISGSFSH